MGERISRLMDGELEGVEAEAAYRELKQPEGVEVWVCYHVIGDTIRRTSAPTPGFSDRFAARLTAEPTILAPKPAPRQKLPFVWAAAATVAAVMVVGWVAVSTLDPQQPSIMANAREAGSVKSLRPAQQVSPDYLIAHQEYSPTTQIQGVGPYLRAVSGGGAAVSGGGPDGRP